MPCITLINTLSNVAHQHASSLAQSLLNTHPGFHPLGVCPHIRSTLCFLKARSNDIFFYLKGFVGSAHGCYSMVCMTSTQFAEMTNRPSADFTVHVYSLHFMFWTHQNLWGEKKEKSRDSTDVLPKMEVLKKKIKVLWFHQWISYSQFIFYLLHLSTSLKASRWALTVSQGLQK